MKQEYKKEILEETTAPEATVLETTVPETSIIKEVSLLAVKMLGIAAVFVLLFTLVLGFHRISGPSMASAIKDADLAIFYRLNKEYVARDVIVLKFENERQASRVVATAGDTVDITEEGLIINGAVQNEENDSSKTTRYEEGIEFPLLVGEGEVFVLADNRVDATDSRIYGTVNTKDTLGKIIMILRKREI